MNKRDYMEIAQQNIEDIKTQLERMNFIFSRSWFDDDASYDIHKASEKIVESCESIQSQMEAVESLYDAIN